MTVIQIRTLQDAPRADTKAIMNQAWPRFMTPDQATMKYWREMRTVFPEYQFLLFDGDRVVGVGNTVPVAWSGDPDELPATWADTFIQAFENTPSKANTLAAVNIAIDAEYRNTGCSRILLTAMKAFAHERGLLNLVVPVRPSFKTDDPLSPFETYIHRKREDGAPYDPWIRTHWRLGAKIVKPLPQAYTVKGTIKEWETWTGQPFPVSGSYLVEGALVPVEMDLDQDLGVYHDPNVWMHYPL